MMLRIKNLNFRRPADESTLASVAALNFTNASHHAKNFAALLLPALDHHVFRNAPRSGLYELGSHCEARTADRGRSQLCRQWLDADKLCARINDDRPRASSLLWRPGSQEKRAGHNDAEFRHDGADHAAVGDLRV